MAQDLETTGSMLGITWPLLFQFLLDTEPHPDITRRLTYAGISSLDLKWQKHKMNLVCSALNLLFSDS